MAAGRLDNLRAWFDEHGWQLEPPMLRAALEERGASIDTIVELLDEGADRRRGAPSEPRPEASQENGGPPRGVVPAPTRRVEESSPARRRKAGGANPNQPAPQLVAPQDLEAEEHVLGAAMLSPHAITACREIVTPADFYRESHATIWQACLSLHDRGEPVDAITLTGELDRTGRLDQVGGRVRMHELAALVPAWKNAPHYAKRVRETSLLRSLIRAGGELAQAGWEGRDVTDTVARIIGDLRTIELPGDLGSPPEAVPGGAFVFDEPLDENAIRIWGEDAAIGWAAGEALMLVGPDGVGKTTLMQQLCLARAGLRTQVLGMPVNPDPNGVLYIAADRPRQAARSIRRMVTETERDQLDQTITFWRGPLPQLLNEDRTILTRLAKQFGRTTIAIDSLKDVAVDLATDEAGGRIATAFQHAIANGIELIVAHHPRKPGVEQSRKPRELADVYGSRLIFGVFGSVIMLWGEPGDAFIDLDHIKQPIDQLGPWKLHHDHPRGRTDIEHGTDLLDILLRAGTTGLTAKEAAGRVYEKDEPGKNETERVRQRLEKLTASGRAAKLPGIRGGRHGGEQARYLYNGPAQALQ